jgi:3',5'-cyclic AMP phosphodiesterase CpdA
VLCGLLLIPFSETIAAESIALISDLNGRYGSSSYDSRITAAIESLVRLKPELVICTGDMVAGQKQPRLDADWLDRMWRGFDLVVADPLGRAGIPLLVTPGNHDGSGFPEYTLERERFDAQWSSRKPELEMLAGSEWPRRYAARTGTVLLLAFDGTRPGTLPATELDFVARMLTSYGESASVTIVFSHLPMWPLTEGREHEILDDPALLSLLHRQGVDVYASGHHHAFFAGVDDAGMVHVGIGALGGNARAFSGEKRRQPFSFAILTLAEDAVNITSRAAPGFLEPVPEADIPATISGPLGILRRVHGPVRLRP